MKNVLLIVAAAALIAGAAFTDPAVAQGRRGDRAVPTVSEIVARADARTARLKADLRLTPEQDKNWPDLESALHDIAKNRADRLVASLADRGQRKEPVDFIEYLNRLAKSLDERSVDMKKLADAAQPLYESIDEQQKRRFAAELGRLTRERDADW